MGIGGLAIALAGQETMANLFGSIAIFVDKPFRVGDRIQIDGYDGVVERIGLRSTRIRQLTGMLTSIPNKHIAESSITNVTMRPTIRHNTVLNLTYDTDEKKMQTALSLLRDIYGKHPQTEKYWVYWRDFGAHSLDLVISFWCRSTDYQEFLKAIEEINLETKTRLEAAGLEFAFPTQTLYLKQNDLPPEQILPIGPSPAYSSNLNPTSLPSSTEPAKGRVLDEEDD